MPQKEPMGIEDQLSAEPLAILGGTFDPVHYGHLRCAEEARVKLQLECLYMLPSGQPPHRATPSATTAQRLEMLRLAQTEFPGLKTDDRETRRRGPSFMTDTLTELRRENPRRSIILLVGQDAANELHTWHEWEQLFELAHIVILTRPETKRVYPPELDGMMKSRLCSEAPLLRDSTAGRVLQLEVVAVDVSATGIKKLIRQGRFPGSMLPDAVIHFINENRIYQTV